MSNSDAPAGSPGGPVTVPDRTDLPERMRIHALARLIGRTSREILNALANLGVEARSAQSSIDRKDAEQVITTLQPASEAPEVAETDVSEPVEAAMAEAAPLAPVFAPPAPLFQAPTPPARREEAVEEAAEGAPTEAPSAEEGEEAEEGGTRRRRRRGRRGRGRGRGGEGEDAAEETDDTEAEAESEEAEEPADEDEGEGAEEDAEEGGDEAAGTTRRRRRRRRRRGSGDDAADTVEDEPGTITRVRPPREPRADDEGDGVQGVRGSTRLEAKRQRRRDGRDAGRRRAPILSEAEFLARREAVERAMVVRERGDRVEIAVLEDDVLVEHFVASANTGASMVGNIYLGRVQNVLPSMEAAFVDIGRGRNAVLYAGEVDWDAAGLGGKARRIEQALSSGDSVLVQVTKDPVGHKGARLTTQISLAGRFLVYVPSGGAAGISRKLPDVERKRLKDMLKEIVPAEAGVIIRTASEGVSQEALERDVRRLQAQWEVVKTKSEQTGPNKPKAPSLLYEEPDLLIKVVRDQFNEDFSKLVVQGDDAWDTLSAYIAHVAPELTERLHRHVGTTDVFTEYRIDEQLLKALDRKVWLPSGGTLVIDRTEAMTVIDVNTGKFTGSGGNLEETVTRNNLEAAEEVVRQLRLRDIGGIIVIDFIDMVLEANRDLVLRRLTECLARDRTRHQVAEVTSLGLVQMTRKRVGGGLLEHFSTVCEHCRGRGVIVSTEPVVEKSGPDTARRTRSRRRGEDERGDHGRNGREVRREPATVAASAPAPNGSTPTPAPTPADTGDAAVDVGAPAATIEPEPEGPVITEPGHQPGVPADVATEAVEEVVVEQSVAAEQREHVANGNGRSRRRGRVTRTAGAPTATSGDAPAVAVVTVPAARDESAPDPVAPVSIPPQPTPAAATRPRRARRAASRPAGPPAAEGDTGGDPV
jgi:ribonuclease E